MVDLGKAKVLEGLVAKRRQQPFVGVGRVGSAVSNLVEEGAQFCRCHGRYHPCFVDVNQKNYND